MRSDITAKKGKGLLSLNIISLKFELKKNISFIYK